MKISKKKLIQIIKEEAADCAKDYRLGTLSKEEYEDCLKRFEEPDDYSYRRYPPRKTSYVGADANQAKIAAIQTALKSKPNNFLQSILSQLQRGRGLSSKQNSIVKKILIKIDPESATLFERNNMKITKEQLKRIIQEIAMGHGMMEYEADERARDEIATQIRNASKDIHGRKDVYDLRGKSIEELEDILYDLANSQEQLAMDDMDRDEMEDQMGREQELSRAEMAPRRQGMGRRPSGSKSQRRMETISRIKKIIDEALSK